LSYGGASGTVQFHLHGLVHDQFSYPMGLE